MLNLTAQQKALVANARARKEGKALTVKLKEQAEADRRQHLMEKRAKALQNQEHVDNKLAVHYIKKELAKYAFGDDYKKKRHRGGRASTVPLIPTRPPEAPKSERIEQALDDEIRRPPRYRAPNAWAKAKQEVKLEKEQKLRASMDNKQQARLYLKRQEEEKQRQRQLEMESEMKYFERQQRDLDRHKEEIKQKQIAKEEKQRQMNAEFNRMVEETREKRERQRRLKMQAELQDVERAKAALDDERHRLEEEKRIKAKQVEQVKIENRKIQDSKRQAKLAEYEYDKKLSKEYQERLAAQERARQEELQKTYERQEKRVNMALLNVVSPEENARQDEARAAVIQSAQRAKEEAMLEERQRKQREQSFLQGAELRKQQEERRRRQIQEREHAAQLDALVAKDALAAEIAARAKQAKKDAIDREYRAKLAQQMLAEQNLKARDDKWAMSQLEMKLNATTLRKAGVNV
ncbi:hypothetical protein LEN26_020046 [Aphanomyces euteiches]|nr:hypothetical protein LEN26_020046 [Aphanomyces euteiches]KAH9123998.1 hypothetical protein AeMF1_005161 [Aphanomyces euteiches]KAH9196787.1 hypothetical protein AeNC1_001261 [Aphanomyces euteiches]